MEVETPPSWIHVGTFFALGRLVFALGWFLNASCTFLGHVGGCFWNISWAFLERSLYVNDRSKIRRGLPHDGASVCSTVAARSARTFFLLACVRQWQREAPELFWSRRSAFKAFSMEAH